jgi:hypothetical protein
MADISGIQFVDIPIAHGKADLTQFRQAGAEVVKIFEAADGMIVERTSIDECYVVSYNTTFYVKY